MRFRRDGAIHAMARDGTAALCDRRVGGEFFAVIGGITHVA